MPTLEEKLKKGRSAPSNRQSMNLWDQKNEGQRLDEFVESMAGTHKVIFYGETGTGKTRAYLKILELLKEQDVPPEDVKMEIIFPDRATGLTKLIGVVPVEYVSRINIHAISNYEELVRATSTACKNLENHHEKTGTHGWLVTELLGELWTFAQDYYTRQSYGETLADFFAEKKRVTDAIKENKNAYKALQGWKDWTVIKHFHNQNWIDKLKKKQFNIIFTAEVHGENREDSIFYDRGRPGGEKNNMHRVDEIIKLFKRNGKYYMRPFKLTGYTKLYGKQDITDGDPFKTHLKMLSGLEKKGFRESSSDQIKSAIQVSMDEDSEDEDISTENQSQIDKLKKQGEVDGPSPEKVAEQMKKDEEQSKDEKKGGQSKNDGNEDEFKDESESEEDPSSEDEKSDVNDFFG